jgi:hypothetical protein
MNDKWRNFFTELEKITIDKEKNLISCNGSILEKDSLTRKALENAGFDELETVEALKKLNDDHVYYDCEVLLNALPRMLKDSECHPEQEVYA